MFIVASNCFNAREGIAGEYFVFVFRSLSQWNGKCHHQNRNRKWERERDSEWGDADEIDRPERRKQTLMLVVKEATTRIQFIDMHHSKGGVQRNNRDKCPLRRTRWDRCLSQQTFPPNLYVYVCFIKLSMRTPWKVAASEFFISFFFTPSKIINHFPSNFWNSSLKNIFLSGCNIFSP